MANKARVRIEAKGLPFKVFLSKFNHEVSRSGVLNSYKQHEAYESKGRKKRRKKREAELKLLRSKMQENLVNKGYDR